MERRVWAITIDDRRRITLPKDLLEILCLKPGDIIVFVRNGEGPVYVGRATLKIEIPYMEKKSKEVDGKRSEIKSNSLRETS